MAPSRATAVLLSVVEPLFALINAALSFLADYGWRAAFIAFFACRYARKVAAERAARERARLLKEALDPARVAALDDRRAATLPGLVRRNEAAIAEQRERFRLERERLAEEAREEALQGGARLGGR
jgi:hypothetical protein